jgi:hypothetical protein
MEQRISAVLQFWIKNMRNSNQTFSLTIGYGEAREVVVFGLSLLFGLALFIIWLLTLAYMLLVYILQKRKRADLLKSNPNQVISSIEAFWSNSHGLTFISKDSNLDAQSQVLLENKDGELKLKKKAS